MRDPEFLTYLAEFGWSGTFDWAELLKSDRVMLLSEAGTGKTFECQKQAARMTNAGDPAFFIPLEALAREHVTDILSASEILRFEAWRNDGSSVATFFLDSIDEMRLSHGRFGAALRRLAKTIDGQLGRAKVVVTSRPIPVEMQVFKDELPIPPSKVIEKLPDATDQFDALVRGDVRRAKREAKQPGKTEPEIEAWRSVALMPLSNEQIQTFVKGQGVTDGLRLIEEIDQRRAWDFARRPQDLIEICAFWREHNALGRRSQQVEQNVISKLHESGERRRLSNLSEDKAMEGAERLALGIVLTRKKTIRISDRSLDDHEEAALDPAAILPDWSDAERADLFERPLFGFASYGRVRFHHRSVYEFLAARRLNRLVTEERMPLSALKRMLFGEKYGQRIVFPSTRSVAAWLALWNDHVRCELIEREPEALIDEGDPESFTLSERGKILTAFASRYGKGDWRGVHIPLDQVRRFADPNLSGTVRKLWEAGVSNCEVRELLIDLIQAGRMSNCLDIACTVAFDDTVGYRDRVTAIQAVADMGKQDQIESIVQAAIDTDQDWPNDLKSNIIDVLFPEHMTVNQFCTLLSQIKAGRHRVGGVEWQLSNIIDTLSLGSEKRTALRNGIANLILESTERIKDWPRYKSPYAHLSQALATLCLNELEEGEQPTKELLRACVAASRFKVRDYHDDKPVGKLRAFFGTASCEHRAAAYQAESDFCLKFRTTKDGQDHAFNVSRDSLVWQVIEDDLDWLLEIAADTARLNVEREAALGRAVRLSRGEQGWMKDRIERCKAAVSDNRAISSTLAKLLKPPRRDRTAEKWERKHRAYQAKHKRKEEKRVSNWHKWRDDLIANPEPFFADDKVAGTIADLCSVMEMHGHDLNSRTGWNKALIAELFNNDIADRVERSFKAYWRTQTVPLDSEREEGERHSVFYSWLYGLTGVFAEAASDPDWATKLSEGEAQLAARYVPLEFNGLPSWTAALVAAHPVAVDHVLGEELSKQLAEACKSEFPGLLADFSNAAEDVQRFFVPRVWNWLSSFDSRVKGQQERKALYTHLEKAIAMCLRHGSDKDLLRLARKKLRAGVGGPFAILWINVLLRLSPAKAVDRLETGLGKLAPEKAYAFSESFFAGLGERRGVSFAPNLSDDQFTADVILRLLRLAYKMIDEKDDIDRVGKGTYSPTTRDDAQRGRDTVLGALLKMPGTEAWRTKNELSKDPLFAHFRDRIVHLAREGAASESGGPPASEADIRQLDQYGEPPPADRDGMFAMMMDRIADLQHDLVHEFSERELLATIDDETMMQQALAKRLHDKANKAYRIDREAEVVDGKKTDIRFLSVRSSQQAVIEIKLGNKKRSAKHLRQDLRDQLVGRYMRHEDCRAGCLLITLNKDRSWEHPDSRTKMSFEELIDFLNEHAAERSKEFGFGMRLSVVGLDLRAPID